MEDDGHHSFCWWCGCITKRKKNDIKRTNRTLMNTKTTVLLHRSVLGWWLWMDILIPTTKGRWWKCLIKGYLNTQLLKSIFDHVFSSSKNPKFHTKSTILAFEIINCNRGWELRWSVPTTNGKCLLASYIENNIDTK